MPSDLIRRQAVVFRKDHAQSKNVKRDRGSIENDRGFSAIRKMKTGLSESSQQKQSWSDFIGAAKCNLQLHRKIAAFVIHLSVCRRPMEHLLSVLIRRYACAPKNREETECRVLLQFSPSCQLWLWRHSLQVPLSSGPGSKRRRWSSACRRNSRGKARKLPSGRSTTRRRDLPTATFTRS